MSQQVVLRKVVFYCVGCKERREVRVAEGRPVVICPLCGSQYRIKEEK